MSISPITTHMRIKKDLVKELKDFRDIKGLPSVDVLLRELLDSQLVGDITDSLSLTEATKLTTSVFLRELNKDSEIKLGVREKIKLGKIVGQALAELYKTSREKKNLSKEVKV